MRTQQLTLVAVASMIGCGDWTKTVRPSGADNVVSVEADAARCFDVVIYGTDANRAKIARALPEMCRALREVDLRTYLEKHQHLLKAEDRGSVQGLGIAALVNPEKIGLGRPPINFYVTATDIRGPGISAVCVDGRVDVPAFAVDAEDRLGFVEPTVEDTALLVNTLAHEAMHLYPSTLGGCASLFEDGDNDVVQCHSLSYVVGNLAACSYLVRQRGLDWETCMAGQADITPGHQGRGVRDALGNKPR